MEFKAVVADPASGKSYQIEVKEDKAKTVKGKKIGDEIDGGFTGLTGYKLTITGGSDKSGFPMRKGVHGSTRAKVLLEGGVGYNPKKTERKRKRVHGETISDSIVQINFKITTAGNKKIEDLLGLDAGKEEEAGEPGDKKEKPASEEKPATEPKEKTEDKKEKETPSKEAAAEKAEAEKPGEAGEA